jgi:hypothetical protein
LGVGQGAVSRRTVTWRLGDVVGCSRWWMQVRDSRAGMRRKSGRGVAAQYLEARGAIASRCPCSGA